jgi:hypothetical protein
MNGMTRSTIDAERLERKRAKNRGYSKKYRMRVKENKARFCLALNDDLVATALFAAGRDQGLELIKHGECEQCLCEWVTEILNAAVRPDLPTRCRPDDSLRSNRGLRPK